MIGNQYPGFNNKYQQRTVVQGPYELSGVQEHTLLQRVCYLLATGLVVSAAGAYVFQGMGEFRWIFFLAAFGLMFLASAVARKPVVNVLAFYAFCLAEGAFLGPFLAMYMRVFPNGPALVWQAFLLTSITVAGVGTYAYTSRRDFSFLGKGLLIALVALILFGLASLFVVRLNTDLVVLGFEAIVVVVFVGFLLYDFSKIRRRYSPEDYIPASIAVYLDFINLFLAILNILAVLQGGGSRRRS